MSEKPLYVRVAEALGLKVRDQSRFCCKGPHCHHVGMPSEGGDFPGMQPRPRWIESWEFFDRDVWDGEGDWKPVPRYDGDWSVAGPLIVKYGISLESPESAKSWRAFSWSREAFAPGPLEAVSRLILSLAEVGKL